MRLIDHYFHLLARVAPRSVFAGSPAVYRLTYERPRRAFGYPRLGLFELDKTSGWRMKPGVTVTHPHFDFRVRYTIDGEGRRVTRSTAQGSKTAIHFIGCSSTFGWGVEDHETYPSLLADDRRVVNWSVPGYGLGHHYLALERRGILNQAAADQAVVIYPWQYNHQERSWKRRTWLSLIDRSLLRGVGTPVFEIEDRALVYRGLIHAADGGVLAGPLVELIEFRILTELCAATAAKVNSAGLRFVVVLLPLFTAENLERTHRLRERLAHLGIETISLHQPDDARNVHYLHRFEGHPNARWHAEIARRLALALGE